MTVLILLAVTIIGFLVVLDRKDKRAFEDRQAHRLEIAALCQRLQAPELAIVQHQAQRSGPDMPAVNPFDHEDYWDAQKEQDEALARMAEIERNGLN